MFEFLTMEGNYEERKVENTKINGVEIDTAAVTDSEQPYETGIKSEIYGDGGWVIVELYDSKEEAYVGHGKWVEKFRDKNEFPDQLEDVSSCELAKLCRAAEGPIKKDLIKGE